MNGKGQTGWQRTGGFTSAELDCERVERASPAAVSRERSGGAMMLVEGKDRLREEVQRMRAMANSGASLGLGVELGMMVQRGSESCAPRACPVQLDLLPLRPMSQSNSCSQAPTSSHNHFTWQPLMASRTNSGSGVFLILS